MWQNQIQLRQWGLDSKDLTLTLNKFHVTNCTIESHQNGLYLAVGLKRISGPFWLSLFVPSICLILAAELTLFIDEARFEALIMVALTSNLVMYTLYNAIQEELPENSSLKLLDIWLLHGLVMPMVVFSVLAANELLSSKSLQIPNKRKQTKVATSAITVGSKFQEKDDISHQKRMKSCMILCKGLIPITSTIFILTYFALCTNV